MRVHLIRKESIEFFIECHPESKQQFVRWLSVVMYARWESPADIQSTFSSADLLGRGSDRVIFNIGGNKYRMICKYFFGKKKIHLFICWIGSHKEYNELCQQNRQYTIKAY